MQRTSLLVGGVSVFVMLGACASEAEPQGGGGAVSLGGAGAGGTTSDGGSGFGGGDSGGGPPIGGGCASSSSKAEPIPLDIFIMLDQSGSMSEDAGNALTKWQTVRAAITEFVMSDSSEGIGVGIQYFGLPTPAVLGCTQIPCTMDSDCTDGCTICSPGVCHSSWNPDEDTCEAGEYAWAEVPIAELPANGNAIVSSLGMHGPGTNTPTLPALPGALQYATTWATAHPDHVTVVAFATDGDPAICGTDLGVINGVAADAFNATPSIKTFVIGVGGSLDALDGIAEAGGTVEAFNVDYDDMATEQFVQALNTIRGAALPCVYQIPPPPDGEQLDFGLVNVEYTPGDGSGTLTIPKVESEADCPDDGNAWYYDDEKAPTQIILCGVTCDAIAVDLTAEVDIALGCQTIIR
jgi:hypothetical protein